MRESLETGLSEAIPSSNRGFQLLSKLGFNAAVGLGAKAQGRTEPIHIDLEAMSSRAGLGRNRYLKEKKERQSREIRRAKQRIKERFRASQSDKFGARKLQHSLSSSQRICRELDEKSGIRVNFMWYSHHDERADSLGELYDPEYHSAGFERSFDREMHSMQQTQLSEAEHTQQVGVNHWHDHQSNKRQYWGMCF